MVKIFVLLWSVLVASPVLATTYWVSVGGGSTSCTLTDGNTDPQTYMTPTALIGAGCVQAGDTVMFKNGIYTTQINWTNLLPSGTTAGDTKALCETHRGCTIKHEPLFSTGGIINLGNGNTNNSGNRQYVQIGGQTNGFIVDGANCSASQCKGINFQIGGTTTSNLLGNSIIGNLIRNHHNDGIATQQSGGGIFTHTNLTIQYNTIERAQTPLYTAQGPPHGIYVKTNGAVVSHNDVASPGSDSGGNMFGIQCYLPCNNAQILNNIVRVHGPDDGIILSNGNGNTVARNIFKKISGTALYCIRLEPSSDNNQVYNNLCHGFDNFVLNATGSTGNIFKNNVCLTGSNCTILGTLAQSTNPVGVSPLYFKDPTNFDYSLLPTAAMLIDDCTSVGLPFNGSAPDCGPHETMGSPTASISTNFIEISVPMNLNTPIDSVITGWSVSCSPTCGTLTVGNGSVLTSNVIRVPINGIAGGACLNTQMWKVSYNASVGTVSDSAAIGGSKDQPLPSFTNLAVTNNCTGSPTPPGSPRIYYKLDGNTTDSSGNGLNGIRSGGSFVAAKYGQGFKVTDGVNEYIEMPYGNTINPSAQSLTIAFGYEVPAGSESVTRTVFGSALGTNQRLNISTVGGNWQIGIQSSAVGTSTSNLAVVPGWNRVCLRMDSGSDLATLYVNGVAATTSGGLKSYTSYSLASNLRIGLPLGFATSVAGGGKFDEVRLWTSLVTCEADYAAW